MLTSPPTHALDQGVSFPCSRKEVEITSFPVSLHFCELLGNPCVWLTAKLVLSSLAVAFSSQAHPLACVAGPTVQWGSLVIRARGERFSNLGWAGFHKGANQRLVLRAGAL